MLQYAPLAYPSLKNLSTVLRNRHMWPEFFAWDFRSFSCCAVGLAEEFWPDQQSLVSEMFRELSFQNFANIFTDPTRKPSVTRWWVFKRKRRHDEVTPEMVADQIDAYLKSR